MNKFRLWLLRFIAAGNPVLMNVYIEGAEQLCFNTADPFIYNTGLVGNRIVQHPVDIKKGVPVVRREGE